MLHQDDDSEESNLHLKMPDAALLEMLLLRFLLRSRLRLALRWFDKKPTITISSTCPWRIGA